MESYLVVTRTCTIWLNLCQKMFQTIIKLRGSSSYVITMFPLMVIGCLLNGCVGTNGSLACSFKECTSLLCFFYCLSSFSFSGLTSYPGPLKTDGFADKRPLLGVCKSTGSSGWVRSSQWGWPHLLSQHGLKCFFFLRLKGMTHFSWNLPGWVFFFPQYQQYIYWQAEQITQTIVKAMEVT